MAPLKQWRSTTANSSREKELIAHPRCLPHKFKIGLPRLGSHLEVELPLHYFLSRRGILLQPKGQLATRSRVTTMNDLLAVKIRTHRRNIQRYSRLLATSLSDLERQYLHKRIADEQAELERCELQSSSPARTPPGKNDRGMTGAT
jgi:hypothetical protein